MRRRELLAGLAGLALPLRARAADLRVNGARLNQRLSQLARFGRTPEGGLRRVAYSEADRAGRAFAMDWMREAGLAVRIDAAGNILGRREGAETSLPPLLFGSHIDSVPDGGNYDGQVGSMAAIEVAHRLTETGTTTRHPLEVVIFQNEENGKTGSRAMAGELTSAELARPTHTEKTVAEGIAFLGGRPERIEQARRRPGEVFAFLELHVEQGGILDRRRIDIGVVEGIVGIMRWNVVVEGFANHAGTTPMDQRRDAMLAAARLVELVHRVATSTPGRQVATIGQLVARPGAANVIPGRVDMTLEIRDLDMDKIDEVFRAIEGEAERVASSTGTTVTFERYYVSRAAPTDARLRGVIAAAAEELGLDTLSMPSGAGHDAQSLAVIAPVGMIFIPSVDGISHSPRELSRPAAIEAGANVLLRSVLSLDDHTLA
jgi:N-carbamoyl-L-amino-acid hydrolase